MSKVAHKPAKMVEKAAVVIDRAELKRRYQKALEKEKEINARAQSSIDKFKQRKDEIKKLLEEQEAKRKREEEQKQREEKAKLDAIAAA